MDPRITVAHICVRSQTGIREPGETCKQSNNEWELNKKEFQSQGDVAWEKM